MAIIASIVLLGCIGAAGAVALNRVAAKFHVEEDPRIAEVEALLPGANCGGCGCKGCHDFAITCCKASSLDKLNCPGAGEEGMRRISQILGLASAHQDKKIAILKCAGTSSTKTPLNATYSGPHTCSIMNLGVGDYACLSSCLGCGDCVAACRWDALAIDPGTGLPKIDPEKCTGCAACVSACPRHLMELRPYGLRGRRVWVGCSNCEKGALTRKQCTVGCIGCGLCVKTCPFGAIEITNNLAYINPTICKTCGKCVPVCPTGAIKCDNIIIKAKE